MQYFLYFLPLVHFQIHCLKQNIKAENLTINMLKYKTIREKVLRNNNSCIAFMLDFMLDFV